MFHSGEHPNIDDPRWRRGFLSMLRPYQGLSAATSAKSQPEPTTELDRSMLHQPDVDSRNPYGDTREKGASNLRCAYCHDAAVGAANTCTGCGTILHRECVVLAGVCPTLGCGTEVRPTRKASHGGRRRRRRVWTGLGVASLAGLWLVVPRLSVLLTMATGLPFESAPARRHYESTDSKALVAECRRLMDDPSTHGGYVHAQRLAKALETYGYFKRVEADDPRLIDSLPAILQEIEPIEVSVSHDAVSFSWDAAGYGYGYSLIILRDPDGEGARGLRQHDRSFNRSIELAPGVWSYYPYH